MQVFKLRATWLFQALADETRFRVVRLLASVGVPLTAGQLAEALGVASSHLSRHLHVLETAGLTRTERKGRSHYIELTTDASCSAPILEAVASIPDESGIFALDMNRFVRGDAAVKQPGHHSSGDVSGVVGVPESSGL